MSKRYTVRKLHISTSGDSSEVDYTNFIRNTPLKHYINECLYESIYFANINKRKFAKMVEIGGTGRILKVDKQHWKLALQNMLPEYEKMEEYVLCSSIKTLMDSINE